MIGVAVKGFDGLVELIAGLWLLIAPASLHALLAAALGEAQQHSGKISDFIAQNIAHVDEDLIRGGLFIVIIFLLSHGVVKLALVYALLKRLLWAYPYSLAVLGAFLIYQLYVCVVHPSIGMALFAFLDVVIIGLVWREWRTLLAKKVV
jgi:uncharacterized membrane protein